MSKASRHKRQFGTIRKLPSGKYQARYTHPETGQRYKAPHTFAGKLDAEHWLSTQARNIALGAWVNPALQGQETKGQQSLGQWVQEHHARVSRTLKATTVETYGKRIRTRILEVAGAAAQLQHIPLKDVSPADIQAWWDSISETYTTPTANAEAYKRLKAALEEAVTLEIISRNPARLKNASRPVATTKDLPELWELEAIINQLPGHYRLLGILTLIHGLRVGEALALRLEDVVRTPTGYMVRVEGNLQRVKDPLTGRYSMIRQSPKTEAGRRTVPILDAYVEDVRAHLRLWCAGVPPAGLLSRTSTGQPVMDTSFRECFNRARKKAVKELGVKAEITPHYGRKFLSTHLQELGAAPAEVGAILGQQDVGIILGTYSGVSRQRPGALMREVNESFNRKRG